MAFKMDEGSYESVKTRIEAEKEKERRKRENASQVVTLDKRYG